MSEIKGWVFWNDKFIGFLATKAYVEKIVMKFAQGDAAKANAFVQEKAREALELFKLSEGKIDFDEIILTATEPPQGALVDTIPAALRKGEFCFMCKKVGDGIYCKPISCPIHV